MYSRDSTVKWSFVNEAPTKDQYLHYFSLAKTEMIERVDYNVDVISMDHSTEIYEDKDSLIRAKFEIPFGSSIMIYGWFFYFINLFSHNISNWEEKGYL